MPKHTGHPQDHDYHSLKKLERSIEVQLRIERHRTEQEQREIELAACFPDGHLVLPGQIVRLRKTLDTEVICCQVARPPARMGSLYINMLRHRCVILD